MESRVSTTADQSLAELLADLGGIAGAIVRVSEGDARVLATLLIGSGNPVLTLNTTTVGTDAQGQAVLWAITRVRDGVSGFYYLRAPG